MCCPAPEPQTVPAGRRSLSSDLLRCPVVSVCPDTPWLREDGVFVGPEDRPGGTVAAFRGSGLCSEPAAGLSHFHWVSLTGAPASPGANHTDSFWAAFALPLYENRRRYLGNRGNGFFKENILSFSLIHCSWRFGALLLNCSFYGYRHLHQQPFSEALAAHIHSQPARPNPPPLFRGFCFIAASTLSGL